jgi:hypothetical protein
MPLAASFRKGDAAFVISSGHWDCPFLKILYSPFALLTVAEGISNP